MQPPIGRDCGRWQDRSPWYWGVAVAPACFRSRQSVPSPPSPLGGKYRLIDIPLSNAINSGLRSVFVLTQFNSASLNAHIARTYRFDMFSHGFIEVLAAEQTDRSENWVSGNGRCGPQAPPSVRARGGWTTWSILSGDHLYRMRYDHLVAFHEECSADITVATIPVNREELCGFRGARNVEATEWSSRFEKSPATMRT